MQNMQTSSELSISEVRILSLASIGGALEFYDFVIFVFLANVIGKLFLFPFGTNTAHRASLLFFYT